MCRPESWFNLNFMSSANYSLDGGVQEQFPLEFLTDLISTPMPRSGSSCLRLRRWSVSHLTSAQNLSILSSGFGLVQFKSSPLSYPKSAKLAGNVRRDKKSLFNFLYPSYLNLTDTFFFFIQTEGWPHLENRVQGMQMYGINTKYKLCWMEPCRLQGCR